MSIESASAPVEMNETKPVESTESVEVTIPEKMTSDEVKVDAGQSAEPVPEKKDTPPKFLQTVQLSADVDVDYTLKNPNEILVEKLFTILADRVKKVPLTTTNIVELIGITIQLVEKLKRGKEFLPNNEKKSIVLNLIRRIVKETPMDEELRVYFDSVFIPLMLSRIIDSLCSLDINQVKRSLFSCCK
jgi:hypothetical protein